MAGTITPTEPNGLACEWCSGPLTGQQRTTCTDTCRSKRWRWLHQVPARVGETVEGPPLGSVLWDARVPTTRRAARRKPSGLQVSYRKAVERIARMICSPSLVDPDAGPCADCVTRAEEILKPTLSERQRARLESRG